MECMIPTLVEGCLSHGYTYINYNLQIDTKFHVRLREQGKMYNFFSLLGFMTASSLLNKFAAFL